MTTAHISGAYQLFQDQRGGAILVLNDRTVYALPDGAEGGRIRLERTVREPNMLITRGIYHLVAVEDSDVLADGWYLLLESYSEMYTIWKLSGPLPEDDGEITFQPDLDRFLTQDDVNRLLHEGHPI